MLDQTLIITQEENLFSETNDTYLQIVIFIFD